MYAESFGIQGASAAVEDAAHWVQWAQAGILAGASDNEATIRYNLNQFWQAKAAAYPAESATGRAQLERLDTYAHGFWQALDAGKMFSASPTYWDFWKKYWLGGTPDRPEAMTAATSAAAAAAGQEAAANRVGGTFGASMATLAAQNAANIPQELQAAQGGWTQEGVNPLGIPLWAWIAGAAALALLFITRD